MIYNARMRSNFVIFALVTCLTVSTFAQRPAEPPQFSVPDINKRAISLVKPAVSDALLFGELDGRSIVVKVVVDSSGNVESAKATMEFSEEARSLAEQAAKESKFEPLLVNAKPERHTGMLQYAFAYEKMDWWGFGTMLASVHNFDNLSVAPVVEKLTVRWAEEKVRLAEVDTYRDVNERIKALGWTIGHFRSKLTGKDQWLFNAAIAVRNVTFWTLAQEGTNREELQAALLAIKPIVESAPPEIPREFVGALKRLSEYKVDPAMEEEQLRRGLMRLALDLRNYPR
jgi:hypothetical protein